MEGNDYINDLLMCSRLMYNANNEKITSYSFSSVGRT